MIFSELTSNLQAQIQRDMSQLRFLITKNQGMEDPRIVEHGTDA